MVEGLAGAVSEVRLLWEPHGGRVTTRGMGAAHCACPPTLMNDSKQTMDGILGKMALKKMELGIVV